jgi:hypothetical protein
LPRAVRLGARHLRIGHDRLSADDLRLRFFKDFFCMGTTSSIPSPARSFAPRLGDARGSSVNRLLKVGLAAVVAALIVFGYFFTQPYGNGSSGARSSNHESVVYCRG